MRCDASKINSYKVLLEASLKEHKPMISPELAIKCVYRFSATLNRYDNTFDDTPTLSTISQTITRE